MQSGEWLGSAAAFAVSTHGYYYFIIKKNIGWEIAINTLSVQKTPAHNTNP